MSPASSADPQRPPTAGSRRAAVTADRTAPDPDGAAAAAAQSPAVHTIELRKRYRTTVALNGLSMTVGRGEVFGFLGPNGAGKTTAVRLLLGLARPTSGEAMVLGAPAGDLETRRKIGYLPELFRYQSWLTAREVLVLHCRLLRLPRPRWGGEVAGALETVGLAGRADDRVGTFSKGMQQRLGLGVALLGEPELIVLDEPTSALDPVGRHQVRTIIRELRGQGATVFLNTHLLEEAEQVCDRVTVIDKGRSMATGTLAELVGQPVQRPPADHRPARRLVAAAGRLRALDAATGTGWSSRTSPPGGCPTWSARSCRSAVGSRRSCPSSRPSKTGSSSCWGAVTAILMIAALTVREADATEPGRRLPRSRSPW